MYLQQLRCVVEIGQTGSMLQAAHNLYMSQPNLSKMLKQLEQEIDVEIFKRNGKRLEVTPEGIEFISHAQSILHQVDDLELRYKNRKKDALMFRFACNRASYTAKLISDYISQVPATQTLDIRFFETNTVEVLELVEKREAEIGKIAIPLRNYEHFRQYTASRGLEMEILWQLDPYVLVSRDSPLAAEPLITAEMLTDYIEIQFDSGINDLPGVSSRNMGWTTIADSVIYVSDRASCLDLISSCPRCFQLTVHTTEQTACRHNVVTIPQEGAGNPVLEAIVLPANRPDNTVPEWLLEAIRTTTYDGYVQIPFLDPSKGTQ